MIIKAEFSRFANLRNLRFFFFDFRLFICNIFLQIGHCKQNFTFCSILIFLRQALISSLCKDFFFLAEVQMHKHGLFVATSLIQRCTHLNIKGYVWNVSGRDNYLFYFGRLTCNYIFLSPLWRILNCLPAFTRDEVCKCKNDGKNSLQR